MIYDFFNVIICRLCGVLVSADAEEFFKVFCVKKIFFHLPRVFGDITFETNKIFRNKFVSREKEK